jgi:hypothetical protein
MTTKKKTPSPAALAKAALKHNTEAAKAVQARGKNKSGTVSSRFTPKRRQHYLDVLQETGEPALARQEVGFTYETIRQHRLKNPDFEEAEEEALRIYRAKLAQEVHRRGVEGVQEPIYWNGMVVGWVTKYSDRLLELHIKRHNPEYRDKFTVKQEHSGAVGLLTDLSGLPKEIRDDLEVVLEKLAKAQEDE